MKKYFSRFFNNNETKTEMFWLLGYIVLIFQLIIVSLFPILVQYKLLDFTIVVLSSIPCMVIGFSDAITKPFNRAWFFSCLQNKDYMQIKEIIYDLKDKIKNNDKNCLSFNKNDKIYFEIFFNLFGNHISDDEIKDNSSNDIEYKILQDVNIIKYSVYNKIYEVIVVPNKLWNIINNPNVIVYVGNNTSNENIISTEDPNILTSDIIEKYSNIFKNKMGKYEKNRVYSFVIELPNDKKLISKFKLMF